MAGLVWKDLLLIRKALRMYGVFVVLYLLAIRLVGLSVSGLALVLSVMLLVLSLSLFQVDDQAGWEVCAVCLPDGRRRAVAARALCILLLLGVSGGVCAAAAWIPSLRGPEPLETVFCEMLGSYTFFLAVLDVALPLFWRLGPERAQPFLFTLVLVPLVLLALLERAGVGLSLPAVAALFGLALAGMGISCLVSVRIAAKKEC